MFTVPWLLTNWCVEKTKKEICKIFRLNSLEITIEANLKTVDFLDISFDLNSGIFKPFIKPNDIPLYVHKSSNHPPSILKNIPLAINKRLSSISANEHIFNQATPIYQDALRKSGYDHTFIYSPPLNNENIRKKQRKWNILSWSW